MVRKENTATDVREARHFENAGLLEWGKSFFRDASRRCLTAIRLDAKH